MRSQKAEGSIYEEAGKSAEYFGSFPKLRRPKFKFKAAKVFSMEETRFLR